MARRRVVAVVLGLVAVAGCSSSQSTSTTRPKDFPRDHVLRVNDIQVIGTHNSYHLRPPRTLPTGDVADYEHPALDVQLDREGVRSFELDAFNGPDFPVAHTPVLDGATNCPQLAACLGVIKRWSDAHPTHVPIFVLIEPKTQTIIFDAQDVPWDATAIARLDATVRSVFDARDLLTPDLVRGRSSTLRSAVTTHGWPTLGATRGRVALVLNSAGPERDLYLAGRPTLAGAPMFVTAEVNDPSAAVIKRDTPHETEIRRLVQRGFIVRSRADDRGTEARAHDLRRARAAIDGGAQLVTTDFPVPDPHFGSYQVRLVGGRPARCDPVSAPPSCRATDIENPRLLGHRG
ncbi:MAG: Ca2+-dependent phosphoinositide-specific phospholipase C [Acidimicrobiia bacterium]